MASTGSRALDRRNTESLAPAGIMESPVPTYHVWILLEGSEDTETLVLVVRGTKSLLDIRKQIIEKTDLGDVEANSLKFYRKGDRVNGIPGSTLISYLDTNKNDPILVRYRFSKSWVRVKLELYEKKIVPKIFRHDTGLWYQMSHHAKVKLDLVDGTEYDYVCTMKNYDKQIEESLVEDEIIFNELVSSLAKDGNDVNIKVEIKFKNRKPFCQWKLSEVGEKILKKPHMKKLSDFERFEKVKLGKMKTPISKIECNRLVSDLKHYVNIFKVVGDSNEATKRLLINLYLVVAIDHLRADKVNFDLEVEAELEGRYGHGTVDYCAKLGDSMLLVVEAKKDDFIAGMGQVIVEMISALENLQKNRKHGGNHLLVYGIVTDSFMWYFLMCEWSESGPNVRISDAQCSSWNPDEIAVKAVPILEWIILMLEHQTENLIVEPEKKKRRIDEETSHSRQIQRSDQTRSPLL